MSQERDVPPEPSPLPDSISNLDSVESQNRSCSPAVSAVTNSSEVTANVEPNLPIVPQANSPPLPDSSPGCHMADGILKSNTGPSGGTENTHQSTAIAPTDVLLSGSSASAFRPFTQTANLSIPPTSQSYTPRASNHPISSTPVSRRSERSTTLPGTSPFSSIHTFPPTISPEDQAMERETNTFTINNNINDDNDDGRTTASAPPCTPAPEPYQQPQSPFRNTRQIKKIDLLAMSRARQSDRAENARRDGRLAPSPRKKDEVLRNSGFTYPASRGFGCSSNVRLSMHHSSHLPTIGTESELSPERAATRGSNTTSPNVDVVSVDEPQPDPTKCMFSIQFHDFSPAEQMMKCNLCGFVTNNSRFYRRHRRLHSRQGQSSLIRCSLCDFSTSQIRKMREHTISHHHMSHPQHLPSASSTRGSSQSSSTQQRSAATGILDPAAPHIQQPTLQSQLLVNSGSASAAASSFILPVSTHQPINLGLPSAIAPSAGTTQPISASSTLGLPTYIPTPLDAVGPSAPSTGLQHPPRGLAMQGNYSNDHQQVTTYMRSVLSNLMSPPLSSSDSSITTTNFFRQMAGSRHHHSTATHHNPSGFISEGRLSLEECLGYRRPWGGNATAASGNAGSLPLGHSSEASSFMKVKTEPPSHGHHHQHNHMPSRGFNDMPFSTRKERLVRRHNRRQSDAMDSESGMDMSSDDPASSPQPPPLQRPRYDNRISTDTGTDNTMTTSTSGGSGDAHNMAQVSNINSVSSQCPMPFIKIEFPPHRDACNINRSRFSSSANNSINERPSNAVLVDREVQCEIISTNAPRRDSGGAGHRNVGGRTQSETVSSAGGGGGTTAATNGSTSSSGQDTRCYFCGVTFDDEVLFSIHIGCHSHNDPFMCNICGKQCHNKYGFYSHIMRGHQARSNN